MNRQWDVGTKISGISLRTSAGRSSSDIRYSTVYVSVCVCYRQQCVCVSVCVLSTTVCMCEHICYQQQRMKVQSRVDIYNRHGGGGHLKIDTQPHIAASQRLMFMKNETTRTGDNTVAHAKKQVL